MKKVLLFSLMATCLLPQLHAQITCNAISFDVDLSASIDTTVIFQSSRNGNCCAGTNCIRFNLKLNPACSYVNFTVMNPAPPGNSAYYQIDCGPPTSLGTPICIVGKTEAVISFCKPGNDNPIYTITAAGALKGSDDITVREGCTGLMNVSGLQAATINWTSIYPGVEGAYNSWLNCTSTCTSVNVTPQTGAPAYVDYKVSGYRLCGSLVSDTIRVYTTPQITVSIGPDQPSVCAGGSSSVTLTAEASGGDAPYNFVWNNGQTSPSITVTTGNTYSVLVTDSRNCLPAFQSVLVTTTPLPSTPVISTNSPVCEGGRLQLSVPLVAGASYYWTGPGGFTSVLQNPVIDNVAAANAGSYRVVVTVGQCSSLPATANVTVNPVPAAPVVAGNSPVCEKGNLALTASNVPGAVYSWNGPAGFTSSQQNPSLSSIALANAGNYYLTVTVNGCTSLPSPIGVIVNALPPAPIVSANSPLCEGSSILLNSGDIANASFLWTGPNGFTSSSQNPVLNNAGPLASGSYFVRATINGCAGPSSSIAVTVNPIPAAPVLSSNQPVCEGSNLNLMASAGASFTWTGPNGFTSTSQNPVIVSAGTVASGSYTAYLTVNGCNSATTRIDAVVNPIPSTPVINGSTTICQGATLNLSTSMAGLTTYNWTGPNGFIATTSAISINNISTSNSGLYSVTATRNSCTSNAANTDVIATIFLCLRKSAPIRPYVQVLP